MFPLSLMIRDCVCPEAGNAELVGVVGVVGVDRESLSHADIVRRTTRANASADGVEYRTATVLLRSPRTNVRGLMPMIGLPSLQ